jgi:hypothetical protein
MTNGVGRWREEFQISRSRISMRHGRTRPSELHEQITLPEPRGAGMNDGKLRRVPTLLPPTIALYKVSYN